MHALPFRGGGGAALPVRAHGERVGQDGRPDPRPSARTLSGPAGLLVTEEGLLVADEGNDRVVLFRAR